MKLKHKMMRFTVTAFIAVLINTCFTLVVSEGFPKTEFIAAQVLILINALSVALINWFSIGCKELPMIGLLLKGAKTIAVLVMAMVLSVLQWPAYKEVFIPCFIIGFVIVMIADVLV
ncbi:MAG: hypothetical protein NE330_08860, partial [Lentisphaeraceae bacterium]|nr:hypothetical protein [Lentisphaeraceae bacterium]